MIIKYIQKLKNNVIKFAGIITTNSDLWDLFAIISKNSRLRAIVPAKNTSKTLSVRFKKKASLRVWKSLNVMTIRPDFKGSKLHVKGLDGSNIRNCQLSKGSEIELLMAGSGYTYSRLMKSKNRMPYKIMILQIDCDSIVNYETDGYVFKTIQVRHYRIKAQTSIKNAIGDVMALIMPELKNPKYLIHCSGILVPHITPLIDSSRQIGRRMMNAMKKGNLNKWARINKMVLNSGLTADYQILSGFEMGFKDGKYDYRPWVYNYLGIKHMYILDSYFARPPESIKNIMFQYPVTIINSRISRAQIIFGIGGYFVELKKLRNSKMGWD